MKKFISLLMVLLTVFTVVAVSFIPSSAAVSAYDELSSSEYAKVYPLKTSGKGIPYYDKLLKYRGTVTYGKSSTAWYDNADYLKLIDVFKNSKGVYVAKIKYSIGSNWATAYIPLSALTNNYKTTSHTKITATGKFYCSAVKGGSKSLWVDKKDTVYKIGESGNYVQIMFPMTGKGYWMFAWCSKSDYDKYCGVPVASIKLTYSVSRVVVTLDTSKTLKMTGKGQKYDIDATITPSNATNKTITWKSSDTSVVTVTSAGVINAVGYGTAKITATAASGVSSTLKVEVAKKAATKITLNKTSAKLTGDSPTITLKASIAPADSTDTIMWKSSNESVATVNKNGKVTAVTDGTAIITATTSSGKIAKATITCEDVFSPMWPCKKSKYISTMYRYYNGGSPSAHKTRTNMYNAFDVQGTSGDSIYAVEKGIVVEKNYQGNGFGYYVVIEHENGLRSLYAHLNKAAIVSVSKDKKNPTKVEKGQIIGYLGNTGNSTGSHLHFEMYNPSDYDEIINPWVTYYQGKVPVVVGGNSYKANNQFSDAPSKAWCKWLKNSCSKNTSGDYVFKA